MKKETYAYPSTMARLKAEYKIFILAFVFIVIADSIGQIQVPLGPGTLILFPIFYSLIMGVISGPEVLKIFNKKEVKAASKLVIVAICPFIAKLGINAGASIEVILSAGPALILQEIGNLGTIFLALPFALLLGLKREAIGATHSINRESNLALITDMFGPDSPETRGSLSIYVVGGMVGTIYFGFMTTMVAALHIFTFSIPTLWAWPQVWEPAFSWPALQPAWLSSTRIWRRSCPLWRAPARPYPESPASMWRSLWAYR